MKLAIFGDVHGNLIALERFVDVTRGAAEAYVCLGDVVNYGPWNDECLELVMQLPHSSIIEGNHERLFLGTEDVDDELPLVRDFFHHSRQFFSRTDLISGLPASVEVGRFRCTHTLEGRRIYQDSEVSVDRDYIIGHTHHQFRIERSGFLILNPGSVGQNRKWIDTVDYLILDDETGDVDFRSVTYDVGKVLSEMRLRQYPPQCIEYYATKSRKASAL